MHARSRHARRSGRDAPRSSSRTVDALDVATASAESRRTCASLNGLDRLHRPDVNLVSVRRALPPWLGPSLTTWAREASASFDQILRTDRYDLGAATHGLPDDARFWMTADVAVLLGRFAQLTNASRLRVVFGAVRGYRCRKFHVDYVRFRLVTTYLGPGTEWLPEHAVHRRALGQPVDDPRAANQAIVRDDSAVRRAGTGDVIAMKGALHTPGFGAVHRSPPIEGTGQLRVVLVASTVEDG